MALQMAVNPAKATEADLDIFDDIDGRKDWWTGEEIGIGPKAIRDFLQKNPDVDTINVNINSNGGDVFDGMAIRNLLADSGKTVNVKVVGIAASIASVIATAGDTVTMHNTSQMMVHNCWTSIYGANAKELRKLADDMDKIMESSKVAYLDKAGGKLTAEKLDELLDAETYLTAEECKEYGLCDVILDSKGQPIEDEPEPETEEKEPEPQESIKKVEDKQPDMTAQATEKPWFF